MAVIQKAFVSVAILYKTVSCQISDFGNLKSDAGI